MGKIALKRMALFVLLIILGSLLTGVVESSTIAPSSVSGAYDMMESVEFGSGDDESEFLLLPLSTIPPLEPTASTTQPSTENYIQLSTHSFSLSLTDSYFQSLTDHTSTISLPTGTPLPTTVQLSPTITSVPKPSDPLLSLLDYLIIAKDRIIENPVIVGLSGAVAIISLLLLCMCCLWLCKRRKHILYYAVEPSLIEEDEEAIEEEGEIHCNPNANTTEDRDSEDDIDSGISGDKRCNSTPGLHNSGGPPLTSPPTARHTEVAVELTDLQTDTADHQEDKETEETILMTAQPELTHRDTLNEPDTRADVKEKLQKEISILDNVTIDWPPASSHSQNSDSSNISVISDIV